MNNKHSYFHSNGKLLITGEYLVLEGATALALPINKGQSLRVSTNPEKEILNWKATHMDGDWFESKISISDLEVIKTDNQELAKQLTRILKIVREINPEFLTSNEGFDVETLLEFHPEHGFGSSSTLISNLARWADIDAYHLQKLTFKGSGYDIACATNKEPLFFKLENNKAIVETTTFNPAFSENIYFVYLGKKQKSLESIKSFRENARYFKQDIREISKISRALVETKSLNNFERLMELHESILSGILKRPCVKDLLFSDFEGSVKSLGGWGGDFVMMTTNKSKYDFESYLKSKSYKTWYCFKDLIIK